MITRVAYLSFHTSPLSPPGFGDAGGMNVYVDELSRAMADRGVAVDVFTRLAEPDGSRVVEVVPGYRVIHIEAGPPEPLPIEELSDHVFEFAESVIAWAGAEGAEYDLVHSHYWLSGWAGLLVKRILGIPHANSFHTLGRVKDQTRRPDQRPSGLLRIAAEHDVIAGSDCIIAHTPTEFDDLLDHYGADPARLCLNPPAIDHRLFTPGPADAARERLGLDPEREIVLFVGRIQALKGADVAVDAFSLLAPTHPDVDMMLVGGPSGARGETELAALVAAVAERDLADRIRFRPPVPHRDLADYYRAATLLLFPSRSESFGLVAVEAQACATPVVAARIGGLTYAVKDGESGILVDGWDPPEYALALNELLHDEDRRRSFAAAGVEHAAAFSWDVTVERLLELYDGITR